MNETTPSRAAWIGSALDRYERPLLRYAARITGDLESARDVVQETFLKLCTADRGRVDGHLAAWLYTVTRNRALNTRKKEGRMNALHEGQAERLADRRDAPDAVAARNESQDRVLAALRDLPGDQQEACRLKFQDQLTYREISQVMGISLGSVSNLLTGALDTVRQRLRAELNPAREV